MSVFREQGAAEHPQLTSTVGGHRSAGGNAAIGKLAHRISRGESMFTGLVERLGIVDQVSPAPGDGRCARITIRSADPDATEKLGTWAGALGDSIAINGACLTVALLRDDAASFDVSPETLAKTTLGSLRPKSTVNMERALRAGDRLGGHFVSGHVDGVGTVLTVKSPSADDGGTCELTVEVPRVLRRYLVAKGSITLDGVSLTINTLTDTSSGATAGFTLVPVTLLKTGLGHLQPQDPVNIEVDVLGKYVERLMGTR